MEKNSKKSPFELLNVRLFIAFRATFNTRFYYPVFAILFLDFGLTLEQFAMFNAAWAATIVLLEVPSGAWADIYGRKSLLVLAGALMVAEMVLLCFAPRNGGAVLFTMFLCNRILSGTAEAAASGADEALAYDTLKKEGMEKEWPLVLERQIRVRSMASIAAMSLGAAVYDPALMQRVAGWIGLNMQLPREMTLRLPLFLTMIMALWTLSIALRMREKDGTVEDRYSTEKRGLGSAIDALRLTLGAGHWILYTPFALVIILAGLLFDSLLRIIITLSSQYYMIIHLPVATFGLITSLMSAAGLFIPGLSRLLVQRYSPAFNLGVMGLITFLGLTGLVFVFPIAGIIPMIFVISVLFMNGFFVSHYLNRITGSNQRATVLSFKGLSFNLAYGLMGLLYSLLLSLLRQQRTGVNPVPQGIELENFVFVKSLFYFPFCFVLLFICLLLFSRWKLRLKGESRMMNEAGP